MARPALIISASYKTDIPAFYSRWFVNRLRAGFCQMTNPYSNLSRRISLHPKDVDAIVFWTKNAGPMLPALDGIAEMGHFFLIQYTITNYPRELEASVTNADKAVERQISRNKMGPEMRRLAVRSHPNHQPHLEGMAHREFFAIDERAIWAGRRGCCVVCSFLQKDSNQR
jgi:hypothetical protein